MHKVSGVVGDVFRDTSHLPLRAETQQGQASCCLVHFLEDACTATGAARRGQCSSEYWKMVPDNSSSRAEQRGLNIDDRIARSRRWALAPVLPLLLFVSMSTLLVGTSALGVDTKLLRRGRRSHTSSRTLSDHSSSNMPHGFYSMSSDVSGPLTLLCNHKDHCIHRRPTPCAAVFASIPLLPHAIAPMRACRQTCAWVLESLPSRAAALQGACFCMQSP